MQPGQTRDINRRLGMTRPDQKPAIARAQRKHMPRRCDMGGVVLIVDRSGHCQRPVSGRNARRDTFARLDADGERGLVAR